MLRSAFNVVEGLIDHQWLGIHHVHPGAGQLAWDVGFLLFGTVLQHTGGADFFHNLSMAVFGRYRGGSAKVAVASSATMGMMSGSAVSNVLTTGPMTIPAMPV